MSAAASITLPLALATSAQQMDARSILDRLAGASDVHFDAATSTVAFKYEFPGNIDGLVRRLRGAGIGVAPTATIRVPIKNLSGASVDPNELVGRLRASPAITDASFDGSTLTATLAPATNAFRYVFEEILGSGLMALDVAAVAHPWEFVL